MNRFSAQSAPAPANTEGASGPPPAMNAAMPPPMAPNALMGAPGLGPAAMAANGPQAAPPPAAPPSPAQIKEARTHATAMIDGLMGVLAKPRGELTKKDVFAAASEMIAKGAFPTPESKQGLIKEMAGLPDDEPGLRKALGGFLLAVADGKGKIDQAFPEAPPMTGGPTNGGI